MKRTLVTVGLMAFIGIAQARAGEVVKNDKFTLNANGRMQWLAVGQKLDDPFRSDDRMYLLPTAANTQPALAGYVGDRASAAAVPSGLFVLSVAGAKIYAITRFHLDELYPRFGLALSLPG